MKTRLLSVCLLVFIIPGFSQQAAFNQNSSRSNYTTRAYNQNNARSNHAKIYAPKSDIWSFGIVTAASKGINSDENTLFRGNSIATKMFGNYYFGNVGLGMSGGFISGKSDEGTINNFITDRGYQQANTTGTDPFNGYLLFGPAFQYGERIKVLAELQGGMFLNNPGSLTIGPPQASGAVRPYYRYEQGDKTLFPGFSGSISLAYPINASTNFFINTEYLQTRSSIIIYDPKNGIDIPAPQTRDVKLINFGIGISKSFGRRDQASGMATGKSNAQFNPKEYTVTKTYQPGKPVYGNITMDHDDNSYAKAYQPGQPVYGNRAASESCGPVTRTVTHPDGTKEEMTFSCPADAAGYIVNSHSTPGVDVSVRTFAAPHVLEQKGIIHRDLAARNIISGRAIWTSTSTGSGITSNKTIITGGTRGGSVNMNSQTSATRTTPNNSFVTMVRMSAREAGSGMATGRRQFEPVFMEGQGSVCNPCIVSVNNPIYQESNQQGTNPMYEGRASVSNPDGSGLNSGIEGLTVSLFDIASGNIVAVTQTEKNGDFFFANVPDGVYSVIIYGNIISKKGYDFYMKSKAEMEGSITWSGETVQVILNTESGDDTPAMKAGISTSRSNLRTKSLTIIDADTDGDGSFDTFTMLGDGSDGSRSNNTGDASVTRVNKVDAFTIKQSAMKMSSTFASKLGGVAKGIQITGITVSGDGSANVTFSDGSTMDVSNAVSVATSGNAKQYNVVIGDLDDDGNADMVLKITKSRSNIQNNRMMNPDEGEELGVVKSKTKSNQSNDRLINPDETEDAGIIKTKTKSNQSNDRMAAGDDLQEEIWSPRSNRIFYEVVAADLDGDGKPELTAKITKSRSNIQNNRIMIADMDGDGLPEAIVNTSRSNIKNLAVGIGDVDGDGVTDQAAGNKLLGGALPGGAVISAALIPGDPIPGLDVKLKRKSTTYEKKVDSDINGRYHVIGPDMEPDTYTMMVTTNIYIDDETLVVLGNKDEMATNEEGDRKATSGIKQTMQTQVMVEAPGKWTAPEPTRAAINNSHSNIKNLLATVSDIEQMLNNDNSGANASAINNSHSNIKNLRAVAMDMDNTLNDLEIMEKDAAMNTVKNKMAAMNMQFLALQQSLKEAGKQYTTVSNVLKTKHDTVKNSIGNIR